MNQERGKPLNATCILAASHRYYRCDKCQKEQAFLSYKKFCCSPNCFKIYAILTDQDMDRGEKSLLLKDCDLSGIRELNEDVKLAIKELI